MLFRNYIASIKEMPVLVLAIAFVWNTQVFAFAGNTHKAITQEAVNRSVLSGDYLDKQLGLTNKLTTELELLGQFQGNIDMRVSEEPGFVWAKTKISILDWLKDGSELEDVPNPRARHHFYDPIRNRGLDNSERPAVLINLIKRGSKKKYPDYWPFDVTGALSFDRAIGNAGIWETEYLNYYYWGYARGLFYYGLTEQSKYNREKYLGSMFVTLGHICHLLEDQGVPAHTRNDFIWGHMVGGYYDEDTPLKDGGNPFEIWVETQVKGDGNTIPSSWLNGVGSNIPAFSSLKKYWDADAYSGQYVGATTPDGWGLCERTNYQFLSFSTMFKNDGSLYAYPNPSKVNAPVNPEFVNGKKYYYRSGYDVPHLAKVSYSTYTSQSMGYTTTYEENALEEDTVSNDYAQRTVPRTINYATGLLNYFFRGKLSVEQTGCNNGKIQITITNKSGNSGVNQTLKGGTFSLYWDDSSGNRTQVTDFTVYRPGTQPQPGNEWNSSTLMNYDESTKAVLSPPVSQDVNYILVYEGIISADPNLPDSDDTRQIATSVKKLCSSCCHWPPTWCSCGYNNEEPTCFGENQTPSQLIAIVSGVRLCSTGELAEGINGIYCLHYYYVAPPPYQGAYSCWASSSSYPLIVYFPHHPYIRSEPPGVFYFSSVSVISECWTYDDFGLIGPPPCRKVFEGGGPDGCSTEYFCDAYYSGYYGGYCIILNPCNQLCEDSSIWEIEHNYGINDKVKVNAGGEFCYICFADHLSDSTNKPGFGANWSNYWILIDPSVF
jgi:hypothetical protein